LVQIIYSKQLEITSFFEELKTIKGGKRRWTWRFNFPSSRVLRWSVPAHCIYPACSSWKWPWLQRQLYVKYPL